MAARLCDAAGLVAEQRAEGLALVDEAGLLAQVMLLLDGSVDKLPDHRSAVTLDGREVGFVGSSARHYELGPVGLALIKRNVPVDAELLADDARPDRRRHKRP